MDPIEKKWREKLQDDGIVYDDMEQEIERLRALHSININLDEKEQNFDDITSLAKNLFNADMSLISFVDADRQWLKSCIGAPDTIAEDGFTEREVSFCQHLLVHKEPMIVEDATKDDRFKNNPLVLDGTIGFYAGVPLKLSDGFILGSICIINNNPRTFSEDDLANLNKFANWVMSELEIKQKVQRLSENQTRIQELVKKNTYLSAGIENSSSSIVITDATQPGDPILYVNQAFTELTGYTFDESVGQNCKFLQGSLTNSETVDHIRNAINHKEAIHTEILNYTKSGQTFWNELRINPVYESDGEVQYFIGVQQDITKRKAVEQHLIQEVFEQDHLFNSLPELIVMLDLDGNIRKTNIRMFEFTNFHEFEVMSNSLGDYIQIPNFSSTLQQVLEQGGLEKEAALITKDKEYIPFEWKFLSVYNNDGDPEGIVAIGKDIRLNLQLQKDVEYAGRLQKEMLQSNVENRAYEMKFLHRASNYVSGDSYGYEYDEQSNSLFVYLIDVMGHGVATALQTSTIKLLFNQVARRNMSVKEKVEWVNEACIPIFPASYFATAFCADIDLTTGEVRYVAAGINYFAVTKDGKTTLEKAPGGLIGLSEDVMFDEHELQLKRGDSLHLMTDGLYDEIKDGEIPDDFHEVYNFLGNLAENLYRNDDTTAICLHLQ
ncbi:PAS domain-containing protein [Halalkalibacillus halophilus]|uniref:PAS domain-containing protein n=1 Tax=Halalkalibacillus halophilus TaxID=392827 RepID=UPI0004096B18|nr:PAS domain-containing protein [Halalkalibacillus halophilus]